MRTVASIVLTGFALLAVVPPVHAQVSHTAPVSVLDGAVQEHVTSAEADRAAMRRLLARPEVQKIAAETGLDLRRAETAVATLEGGQLTELAAQARQVQQSLAGGQSTITISTTLIIIALLILILVIVAV